MTKPSKFKIGDGDVSMEVEANEEEVSDTKSFLLDEKPIEETSKDVNIVMDEKPKKVKIVIQEGDGEENQGDVFVSVNGTAYQIKRGFEVEVPEEVVEVLEHAVSTKMTQNMNTQEMYFKDVPRFPFRVIR